MTDVKEQQICITFYFILGTMASETRRMHKEDLVIMPKAKYKPTSGVSVSRTGGCQSMLSILDDLQPEPQPKVWLKFNIEGIVHMRSVPPGQTVNGKLCCDVQRQLRENIWHKHSDKWCSNSWALHHDRSGSHVAHCAIFFGIHERSHTPLPTNQTTPL
jgi:hypothetical protein